MAQRAVMRTLLHLTSSPRSRLPLFLSDASDFERGCQHASSTLLSIQPQTSPATRCKAEKSLEGLLPSSSTQFPQPQPSYNNQPVHRIRHEYVNTQHYLWHRRL